MIKRLLDRIRTKQAVTPQDVEARAEAKRMREDMETLRTGSLDGAPMYTHGGRQSRRGD